MQRLLSTALLLGLLLGTAAAFALTEELKLQRSPIFGTAVQKTFSPVCRCAKGEATIDFRLRRRDTITVDVLTSGREVVRRLADAAPAKRGMQHFVWRGRTDEGGRAPDGVYRVRVHLARERRTILFPDRIALDTHPPRVVAAELSRSAISPDRDGQADSVRVSYRLSEPARALVTVDGVRVVRTKTQRVSAVLTWYGTRNGRRLPPGTYALRIGAEDRAGNVSAPRDQRVRTIRIRYIQLAHRRLVVPTGVRFAIAVDTDASSWSWRLGRRRGTGRGNVPVVVRAPAQPGRYRLVVAERGHVDRGIVIVKPRR